MAFPSTPLSRLHGSAGPVHALTYSASPGTYILTGSADRNIRLYNPFPKAAEGRGVTAAGKLVQVYSGHGHEVLDVSVSSDNARLASCGGDRAVFLWDVSTAQTIRRFGGGGGGGHAARVNSVAFGGVDDSLVVSGSFDASVRIWDAKSASHRPIQVLSEAKDSVSCVVVGGGGGGGEIIAGSVDGRVRYYDVRMGQVDVDVLGSPVTSLRAMRGGEAVLVGTLDSKIRLMDRGGGACLMVYGGAENQEFRIRSCFGGKERWVISGNEEREGEVVVWDTVSGAVVQRVLVESIREEERVRKRAVDKDGNEKTGRHVVSCVAWKNEGRGEQWCAAGTDGVVTVFGVPS